MTSKTQIKHPMGIALIAILIAALGPFVSDMYLPALPDISHSFHVSDSMIQYTIASYLLGILLSPLIYGPWSDRVGRRKVIRIGLGIALIGSVLCVIAPTVQVLIAARLVQGLGMGSGACLFRAIMRDIFTGTQLSQVSGIAGMIFWLAPTLAPILGGFIEAHYSWRLNFVTLLILISLCYFITWRYLTETHHQLNTQATQFKIVYKTYFRLLKNKIFMAYVLCSSMSFAGLIAYATTSPFVFEEHLGLSPEQYGLLAIYITISAIIGRIINGAIVKRYGIKRLICVGSTLMLCAAIIMLSMTLLRNVTVISVILPTAMYILGGSFIGTNAMAGAFSPLADIAGAASAIYSCIQLITPFVVCGALALLQAHSAVALAIVYLLLAFISLTVFYIFIRPST